MNVTTPATQSLIMADIIDTVTDSVSSAFNYYMYTGSVACDADSGDAIKQFYFVAEDMLKIDPSQVSLMHENLKSGKILGLFQFALVPSGGSPSRADANCRKIMSILVPDGGVAGECTMF